MLTTFEIQPEKEIIQSVNQFIYTYARPLGIADNKLIRLQDALERVLGMMIINIRKSLEQIPIKLKINVEDDLLNIHFINLGRPLYTDELLKMQLEQILDHFSYYNHGREGQEICLGVKIKNSFNMSTPQINQNYSIDEDQITICELKREQICDLSKLFYSVYGYHYKHEWVYYPDELQKMVVYGDLISYVAMLPNGQIIGHLGMVRINNENSVVYKIDLLVIDPSIEFHKIFSRLHNKITDISGSISMQYCLNDCIISHDRYLNQGDKSNAYEMSILVGGPFNTIRGKIENLERENHSTLLSVRPQVSHPFGHEVVLPTYLGKMTEFILGPLNIQWVPTPDSYLLPPQGKYRFFCSLEQKTIHFDLYQPGKDCVQKIIEDWKFYSRSGYKFAMVDFPLDFPGIEDVHNILAQHSFFISGLIPYNMGNRLGFRFQSLGDVQVAFEKIHLSSENGKQLLAIIQQDYQKNCSR